MGSPALRTRPLHLAWSLPVLVTLALSSSAGAQVVQGTVIEVDTEIPVAGAQVVLDRDGVPTAAVIADSAGAFRIEATVAGSYLLRVERIGYGVARHDLWLGDGESVWVEVRLGPAPVEVEPVQVVARRQRPARLRAFDDRVQESRRLGRGHTYTREDLERIRPVAARQLLFGVPGRHRCEFEVFSDGLPIGSGEAAMDQLPYPDQLEGVEIYRGVTQIPSQYYRYGMCGVVLAWTRPGGEDGRPFSWGRALAGGALLLLILIIH